MREGVDGVVGDLEHWQGGPAAPAEDLDFFEQGLSVEFEHSFLGPMGRLVEQRLFAG